MPALAGRTYRLSHRRTCRRRARRAGGSGGSKAGSRPGSRVLLTDDSTGCSRPCGRVAPAGCASEGGHVRARGGPHLELAVDLGEVADGELRRRQRLAQRFLAPAEAGVTFRGNAGRPFQAYFLDNQGRSAAALLSAPCAPACSGGAQSAGCGGLGGNARGPGDIVGDGGRRAGGGERHRGMRRGEGGQEGGRGWGGGSQRTRSGAS